MSQAQLRVAEIAELLSKTDDAKPLLILLLLIELVKYEHHLFSSGD